mgnify:CR=1 FL=1
MITIHGYFSRDGNFSRVGAPSPPPSRYAPDVTTAISYTLRIPAQKRSISQSARALESFSPVLNALYTRDRLALNIDLLRDKPERVCTATLSSTAFAAPAVHIFTPRRDF